MGPQDPPNRPRSPEEINGPKLRGLAWEFDNFLEAWRFGVFWGSEETLEKSSWESKSIGYQAFYRFKCVLGIQIYRIPGFLWIKTCFCGSNSANFADRERPDPFIYRVWGLCANRFSETRCSTAGPYSLNFRSAFYKSTVKLGI